ncbi:MAG: hypothetical protein R3B84_01460 [Zavarzinella sp.]
MTVLQTVISDSQTTYSAGTYDELNRPVAPSVAPLFSQSDANDLAAIITAWPQMPDAIKAAIKSLVTVSTAQHQQAPKQLSEDSLPWEQAAG